jgi:hypothetical protein
VVDRAGRAFDGEKYFAVNPERVDKLADNIEYGETVGTQEEHIYHGTAEEYSSNSIQDTEISVERAAQFLEPEDRMMN